MYRIATLEQKKRTTLPVKHSGTFLLSKGTVVYVCVDIMPLMPLFKCHTYSYQVGPYEASLRLAHGGANAVQAAGNILYVRTNKDKCCRTMVCTTAHVRDRKTCSEERELYLGGVAPTKQTHPAYKTCSKHTNWHTAFEYNNVVRHWSRSCPPYDVYQSQHSNACTGIIFLAYISYIPTTR